MSHCLWLLDHEDDQPSGELRGYGTKQDGSPLSYHTVRNMDRLVTDAVMLGEPVLIENEDTPCRSRDSFGRRLGDTLPAHCHARDIHDRPDLEWHGQTSLGHTVEAV